MRLFRHWTDLPADARGSVAALGNFDGVHRGHRVVIGTTESIARAAGAPLSVLTFEPHPRQLFRPDDPPFRLTPFRIKARHLEELGVDLLFVLHFDAELARMSAADFVDTVLVAGLGVRHVVVGRDFVFGHKRGGNVDVLRGMAQAKGFEVTEVGPAVDGAGAVFSSTRARTALAEGRPREAAHVLGRPWEIEGRVGRGFERGRTIGFPTANIPLDDYLRPAFGVYAVRAGIDLGSRTVWHGGVANLGRRPTIGGTEPLLEVHLFDYAGDLYGRHVRVQLIEFLRTERKFDGLEALKEQIAKDAAAARSLLAT